MQRLRNEILACTLCERHLPHGPRPVFQVNTRAGIVIIGQAPGRKVHESGVPWDDASGDRLRDWLGVDKTTFYDSRKIALVPMGFCYPGKGSSGDMPPREECAPTWHHRLMAKMPNVALTLLIGQYAQDYYLQDNVKDSLTDTVRSFREYLRSNRIVLPHPSPRNNIWLRKNGWFEKDLLPILKKHIAKLI